MVEVVGLCVCLFQAWLLVADPWIFAARPLDARSGTSGTMSTANLDTMPGVVRAILQWTFLLVEVFPWVSCCETHACCPWIGAAWLGDRLKL